MKNKLIHWKFLHSKIEFLFSYVLELFVNLSVVAEMLPIMVEISTILKSDYVKTLKLLLLLERKWKGMTILRWRNIIYFAIIDLVLIIFPY